MEIEWQDPPETAKRSGGKRPGKYHPFATALKEHPEKWARLPNEEKRRPNSAAGLAQNIRRGKVSGFEGSRWETAIEEGDIWVCYLGPVEKKDPEPEKDQPEGEGEPEEVDHDKVAPILASTMRAWAKENGYDVPERGRLPADVVEAYKDAVR